MLIAVLVIAGGTEYFVFNDTPSAIFYLVCATIIAVAQWLGRTKE